MSAPVDMLALSRENGKAVTCDAPGRNTIALVFWRKNQTPLLPLNLSPRDARRLRDMLDAALTAALGKGEG